jgi:two-component system, NtrC family, sensor kinase
MTVVSDAELTSLRRAHAELQRRLDEAIAQRAASAEVMGLISTSPGDGDQSLRRIAEITERLFGASSVSLLIAEGEHWGRTIRVGAGSERIAAAIPLAHVAITPQFMPGAVYLENRQVHVPDIDEPMAIVRWPGLAPARAAGTRTMSGTPLRREKGAIGALIVHRDRLAPFTEDELALLQSFADQAAIATENARLFSETREALERQTATADVLKVIASSPSDVQPVFEAIVNSAARLFAPCTATITTLKNDVLYWNATAALLPDADVERAKAGAKSVYPIPFEPDRAPSARAILDRQIVVIHDIAAPDTPEFTRKVGLAAGFRSAAFVPLISQDRGVGTIILTQPQAGLRLSEKQLILVQTFADQAAIAIENTRLFNELRQRTTELSQSLENLRTAQDRLIQTEKLASLGQLTAGIAHEIKNPLNFVNNFSALSAELIDELDETLASAPLDQKMRGDVGELTQMLKSNLEKVVHHGRRADSIVKNMLLHSREGSGEHRSADINALVEESLNLAYHGARAEKPGFNIMLKRDLDPDAGAIDVYPQEITRALLNLISNGFYAATQRKSVEGETFEPVLIAATKKRGQTVEIRIRDNGTGIPDEVKEKIFNPFFTTKPSGEGTGLGLSMSHDIIVKQHGGNIDVETEPGLFTEFKIVLPRTNQR